MEIVERVERCIENFRTSARELRIAAQETDNNQASNAFIQSAQKVEDCIQQCQIAINQFR